MTDIRYYVVGEGEEEARGPFTIAELRAQVDAQTLGPGTRINKVGDEDWAPLATVVAPRAPQPQPPAALTAPAVVKPARAAAQFPGWVAYAILGLLVVLLIEFGFLAKLFQDSLKAEAAAIKAHQTELFDRAAETALAADRPPIVSYASLKNNCRAINSLTTCHLTNTSDEPVAVCFQGLIVQKGAAGVRLYSMPACSGPIGPRSTREVSAPWDRGNADDLCKNERGFLEWEKCEFTVLDFDPAKK